MCCNIQKPAHRVSELVACCLLRVFVFKILENKNSSETAKIRIHTRHSLVRNSINNTESKLPSFWQEDTLRTALWAGAMRKVASLKWSVVEACCKFSWPFAPFLQTRKFDCSTTSKHSYTSQPRNGDSEPRKRVLAAGRQRTLPTTLAEIHMLRMAAHSLQCKSRKLGTTRPAKGMCLLVLVVQMECTTML